MQSLANGLHSPVPKVFGIWNYGVNKDIILTSLNRKDMYIQISFKYYNEDTKLEIAKMIGTIECTGNYR